ncbi:MAG: hypothetical protein JSW61_00680 [Candidatus Thorarchaeota archaeon]|nr:MAG: hypothetical protein JSW61_00680 [Candidatus Thorarchaeota archaeon]
MNTLTNDHALSLELASFDHIRRLEISSEQDPEVVIEGVLGEIQRVTIVERMMLEIEGTNGVLRMDLTEHDIKELLKNAE